MPPDQEPLSRVQPQDDCLASYRRLIALQKQMIELSQQHELSKRECNALRAQVAREVARRLQTRRTWRHRVRQSANWIWKQVPGFPSGTMKGRAFDSKKVLPC